MQHYSTELNTVYCDRIQMIHSYKNANIDILEILCHEKQKMPHDFRYQKICKTNQHSKTAINDKQNNTT